MSIGLQTFSLDGDCCLENCIWFTFGSRKSEVTLLGMWDMLAAFARSTLTSYLKDFLCHSSSVEWLYLGSASSSTKGCKPSPLTAECPKHRWSWVVFPRAVSSVRFFSTLHSGHGMHRRDARNQLLLIRRRLRIISSRQGGWICFDFSSYRFVHWRHRLIDAIEFS